MNLSSTFELGKHDAQYVADISEHEVVSSVASTSLTVFNREVYRPFFLAASFSSCHSHSETCTIATSASLYFFEELF